MTKLDRIEKDVAELSPAELERFRAWFEGFDAGRWDRQVESDTASGALDSLAERALEDHRAGRSKPL